MSQPSLQPSVLDELACAVGPENVLTSAEDRICYSYDGQFEEHLPDAIVRPTDEEQVSRIIALANDELFAVVPRGGGTGLTGGSVPSAGGVVLDLTRMNRILEIDEGNLHVVVEPGVITAALATEVEKRGLMYPPDPGSLKVSTIGGNAAENAGGLRACKYGVTRDYLMQVQAVAPTGEVFRSGAKTRKCVTGYDLTSLLSGSEGTLGVFTQLTLRLVPYPKYRRSMTATFGTTAAAGAAVASIISAGLSPATLEIIDNVTLRRIEEYVRLGLPVNAGAMVLAEFDGSDEEAVRREADVCLAVLKGEDASTIQAANESAERDRIWEARRSALAALSRARPTTILEDVTVPLPKLVEMIEAVERIAEKNSLAIGTFGHAGDGNLHPTILTDRRDQEEWQRVTQAVEELMAKALELGGTLSGEHGIGFAKAPFLAKELGEESIELMRRIKRALDPNNILNPGKFL